MQVFLQVPPPEGIDIFIYKAIDRWACFIASMKGHISKIPYLTRGANILSKFIVWTPQEVKCHNFENLSIRWIDSFLQLTTSPHKHQIFWMARINSRTLPIKWMVLMIWFRGPSLLIYDKSTLQANLNRRRQPSG